VLTMVLQQYEWYPIRKFSILKDEKKVLFFRKKKILAIK
jgi:hypothetical protein